MAWKENQCTDVPTPRSTCQLFSQVACMYLYMKLLYYGVTSGLQHPCWCEDYCAMVMLCKHQTQIREYATAEIIDISMIIEASKAGPFAMNQRVRLLHDQL